LKLEVPAPILPDWPHRSRLWLVLDRYAAQPRSLETVTELCIEGGVQAVVFRAKEVPALERKMLAGPVAEVCREEGVPLVVAHDNELAVELGAQAVHLGIADPPIKSVAPKLPSGMLIGYSAHSAAEAARAFADGADYAFVGPIFDTASKRQYGPPLGLSEVEASANHAGPIVYIGGITVVTATALLIAGGTRIAAIGALQAVEDPRKAALELRTLLDRAGESASTFPPCA
jgi:thiamine-phosphate pyrophosphorylase